MGDEMTEGETTVTFVVSPPFKESDQWKVCFQFGWPDMVGIGDTESDAIRNLLDQVDAA